MKTLLCGVRSTAGADNRGKPEARAVVGDGVVPGTLAVVVVIQVCDVVQAEPVQ